MTLQALIFDLDGVITDTAEYHYQAWKRLADEEGLPFDRTVNERLRGVSRRASLEIILGDRQVSEARMADMMARKNAYYQALLDRITPADLLPGALDLLKEARAAGIKLALGSASKNARTALERLGVIDLLDAVGDGYSVARPKPAPDLFLHVAAELGVSPAACAVVEDAAAGVDAALAGGMWAIGIGPEARVGRAHARFESLEGVTLAMIEAALERASWTIAEARFQAKRQRHKETIFTIGNGYQCVRGTFEEGHPGECAAGFIHRLWDYVPIHFTELANIPAWWNVDIWVDGERFRLDRGRVLAYRRELDLRTGQLRRRVRWRPRQDGPVVELRFQRFVSLDQAHVAALRIEVEAISGEIDVRIRTGLNAYAESPLPGAPAEIGFLHWARPAQSQSADAVTLQVRTRQSGLDLAMAAMVAVQSPRDPEKRASDADGQPAVERSTRLAPGESLTLDKFVGAVSGLESAQPATDALLTAERAKAAGFDALSEANAAAWSSAWDDCDVIIEGDIEAQLAVRFNLFQLLIAAPRFTEFASIGAKTLSGFGYRHHVFWDAEIFMTPFFTFTRPRLARNMLMYRYHNLPGARAKARSSGYAGAQFPWESASDGRETTPTWLPHPDDPGKLLRIWTGDIEIHITADVAYAVMQHWRVTGDDAWMRDFGAEMVLDGANFWASAARLEEDGRYHFRDVIGPDEYHDHIDDNAFTNYLAAWHLRAALDVLDWLAAQYPEKQRQLVSALDLTPECRRRWRYVADHIYTPLDTATGLIEQFSGYFDLEPPDFSTLRDPQRAQSMQALLGIEGCHATQVIKQPDVLMLQYLLPDLFTREQLRVNYDYYAPRTDHEHGSSLGPGISAIMACRNGYADEAYEHFMRAARADLQDVRHNAGDGIHGASAGGLWMAAVFGFAGLRVHGDDWTTEPRLPQHWTRLSFPFWLHGQRKEVIIVPDTH